jgi:hypothetical protein
MRKAAGVKVMKGVMENVELDWTTFENALTQLPFTEHTSRNQGTWRSKSLAGTCRAATGLADACHDMTASRLSEEPVPRLYGDDRNRRSGGILGRG